MLDYLRYGELSKNLSETLLRKLKKEADFFLLDGLRKQIQIIYPEDDDQVEIVVRGTRFTITRRFLTRYQANTFANLFNPKSETYIQPREDGCVEIDCEPKFIEWFLARMECDPNDKEGRARVWKDFVKKYDGEVTKDMVRQWFQEFEQKYHK